LIAALSSVDQMTVKRVRIQPGSDTEDIEHVDRAVGGVPLTDALLRCVQLQLGVVDDVVVRWGLAQLLQARLGRRDRAAGVAGVQESAPQRLPRERVEGRLDLTSGRDPAVCPPRAAGPWPAPGAAGPPITNG